MLPYGSRDGNTWEKSVSCQCASYIKQFMKSLMMQTVYLQHMTEETLNIILTFILSHKPPAIPRGNRLANMKT